MGKLSHTLFVAAVALISFAVDLITSNSSDPKSIVIGLVIIIVGVAVAMVWKSMFEEEIRERLKA